MATLDALHELEEVQRCQQYFFASAPELFSVQQQPDVAQPFSFGPDDEDLLEALGPPRDSPRSVIDQASDFPRRSVVFRAAEKKNAERKKNSPPPVAPLPPPQEDAVAASFVVERTFTLLGPPPPSQQQQQKKRKQDADDDDCVREGAPLSLFPRALPKGASPKGASRSRKNNKAPATSWQEMLRDLAAKRTTLEALRSDRAPGHVGAYNPQARRARVALFHSKRHRRVWSKKVKYDVRKNFADSRMRVKGRFLKKEDEDLLKELTSIVI